jgi:diguanylate cyclase (GGDEF)-like protein/PAS domain S-box-containing protein
VGEPTPLQMQMITGSAMHAWSSIILLDEERAIEWANPTAEVMFGWDSAALLGRKIGVLFPDDSQGLMTSLCERAVGGEIQASAQMATRRRDGAALEVEVSAAPFSLPDEGPSGISLVIRDVTQEKVRTLELDRLHDWLESSFAQAEMPQALLDLTGRFLDLNDALALLLGRPRDALVGQSALDLLDPRDPIGSLDLAARIRTAAGTTGKYEVVAQHARGHQVPLRLNLAVLKDRRGEATGVTVFAQDLRDVRNAERRLAAQQAFYRALNRRAWDVALVADPDGNLVYISPSVADFMGYQPAEMITQSGYDFIHPDDVETIRHAVEETVQTAGHVVRAVIRVRHASGDWLWVEETLTNCLTDPDIGGLVANLRDITAEVETHAALEQSEARYRAIAETAHEGIIAMAPDGETLFANEKFSELVGYPLHVIYEKGLMAGLAPREAEAIRRRLAGRPTRGPERYEFDFVHPDGTERVLSISASPLATSEKVVIGSLAMVSDVTAERRAQAELRRQALHDPLTGLPNRALLEDRLAMAAARRHRSPGGCLAVLFLDLDKLKLVNDHAGHGAGDTLLQEVGGRLQSVVRETDTVARLGGDEFAVICEDTDPDGALSVARRIQGMFEKPFTVQGRSLAVTASIGVALSPPHATEELLRLADAAMYHAKEQQPGSIVLFDSAMGTASRVRSELTASLSSALERDETALHYQPIVDLRSGRLRGLESLFRWTHPVLGRLPALDVMTAAHAAGLEVELDRWVLRAACSQMSRLVGDGLLAPDTYVSVNISARTAASEQIDVLVPQVLAETGLEASQLVLEITETSIMTDVEHTIRKLGALSVLGVRVAVDDFGTGYSSLAYLQRLPISILKIDRSFVTGVADHADSRNIVRTVLSLADSLGLDTVAEGIETAEQADALIQLGCRSGQGYLWSPAVSPGDLEGLTASLTGVSGPMVPKATGR